DLCFLFPVLFILPIPVVNTEAPIGPLYRVVGSKLSISCNVSGFKNADTKKHFEFRVNKPGKPMSENIVSSSNPGFSYSSYKRRLEERLITLTHVSPNSVLFEILSLQKSDEGDYECSVLNAEASYDGAYSASTSVKGTHFNEGEAFTSTCQASSNTVQHTHLSLTWFLLRDGDDNARPIISVDRYFTLSPGQGFEGRHQAGLIRLDKIGGVMYRLSMGQLQLSDSGRVFCRAQEWIQDPDRSWYSITQKDAEETVLHVVPDTSPLLVRISLQPTALQVGQTLSINCNVNKQSSEESFFSVAWSRGGVELARVGPTGILSVGHEYSVREEELRVARISDRDFRLRLQPVRIEDQGEYICRAWPQKRGQDGALTQGAAQDSDPQRITISATESGLSLEMQNDTSVNEGDGLKLTCRVHGYKGQLSITWQHKPTATSSVAFTTVISLSQEGVVIEKPESQKMKATRPAADTFTLELDEVKPSDSGVYQCAVSEWENNRKTNSRSQTAMVTVVPAGSFVKVNLISRDNSVTIGENVILMCRIRGVRFPMTVTWSLQRDASIIDNILTVYADGAISWSADQHRYQLNVEKTGNGFTHKLLIRGASHREVGRYECSVSYNAHKIASNQLAVQVQNPVSSLALTSSPALTTSIDQDIEIRCSVTSEPSASTRYFVTWQHKQKAESKIILSSDQDAKVEFGLQVDPSQRQRISAKRSKGPSFELSIRQTQISDGGVYLCKVAEWLQDPLGDWYQLPSVSRPTNLTVMEPGTLLYVFMSLLKIKARIFLKPDKQQHHNPRHLLRTIDSLLHPTTNNSSVLTVMKSEAEDSGRYFCEVEEWLPSLSQRWRKVATNKSGILTVNVYPEGKNILKLFLSFLQKRRRVQTSPTLMTDMKISFLNNIHNGSSFAGDVKAFSEPASHLGACIGILVAVVICSLLVILLLVVKICRSKVSGEKKTGHSLWAEQHPLNTKPSADD
uniref:Immunoglobulin superfamily member 3-like n=1 Tax=Labrus bergylta TaxID=56723 RepID=A0A3Q3GJW6_9LABR